MTRTLIVDEEAQDEAEAQAAYYVERAGTAVALAFVAELEAIYRGLAGGRLVAEAHARELPDHIRKARQRELDPDRRIIAMLGVGKTVAKTSIAENETSGISAA